MADDAPLDWELEAQRQPGAARLLAGLRVLHRIGAAYARARAQRPEEPSGEPAASPVFVWGFLRVLTRIGEGAFGEVWRAYDPSLQREVALKLRRIAPLPPDAPALALTSDPATRRTLDEARRLARVRHPHVLTVFGAAEHDGRAGIWTELIRGETLEARLARAGPLREREAVSIGVDLCGALAAVHAAGLVHGDIKGANVMLEDVGAGARPRVVLMDFSAAHERRERGHDRPVVGTPLLMAPELLAGGAPTPRSDLYALGALLCRLLTGRYPFEADSLDELRERLARGERPALPARAGLSRGIARVVLRALAPRPEDRFASAADMRQALLVLTERRRTLLVRATVAAVAVAAIALALAWWQLHRPSPTRFVALAALPGTVVGAPLVPADTLTGGPGVGLGWMVAPCGDVNGDGLADVLVSSTSFSGALYAQGRVQLYLGSRTGRFGRPAQTWLGDQSETYLATSMAVVGDVDGDGRPDLMMSDGYIDAATHRRLGSVSLFRGRPGSFESVPSWRVYGTQDGARFGHCIAGIGDVNGDGRPDVLVSADHYEDRFPDEGAVFLYLGTPDGLSREPAWVAYGGCRNAELGFRLTRVGDVNGDGYDDILLGSLGWSRSRTEQGRLLLYYGGPRGPRARPDWVLEGDQPQGWLGRTIVGVGDVDGDGCADFLAAQPHWSGRGIAEGRVMLFLGGRRGPRKRPLWVEKGYGSAAELGSALAAPGDVDGDGRPDFVTGAWGFCDGRADHDVGLCTVHLGGADPAGRRRVMRMVGADPGTPIGEDIVAAGDFNGDGLADLLVTEPRYPTPFTTGRGRVFLLLGRRTSPGR